MNVQVLSCGVQKFFIISSVACNVSEGKMNWIRTDEQKQVMKINILSDIDNLTINYVEK